MADTKGAAMIFLRDGKFDQESGTSQHALDSLFADIRETNPKHVVVHFHGGLIDRQEGIRAAESLNDVYRRVGVYPVFFNWESGWREVLEQNLPAIFRENLFQKMLTYLTRFAKGKVAKAQATGVPKAAGDLPLPKQSEVERELEAPSNGREPYADLDPHILPADDDLTEEEALQLKEKMGDDPVLEALGQEMVNALSSPAGSGTATPDAAAGAGTAPLMSPEALAELVPVQEGTPKGLFSTTVFISKCTIVLGKIIGRFVKRRDHGFYPTIVEEILRAFYVGTAGKFLWDGMKGATESAFGFGADCGGSQFLKALDGLWRGGICPQLTLVGHSAGAIYVCRFLQEVQTRKLPEDMVFRTILIAPACDFKFLAKTLQSAGDRIAGARIFGMKDDLERKDPLWPAVPALYPRSLLYFVSGVLEAQSDMPLAGMARYYGKPYIDGAFPDIDYVRSFRLFKPDHALVWAMATAGHGLNCDMVSHGGWAQTEATVQSVLYILEKGYGHAAIHA
jgi:hypothetical protein